MSLTLRLAPKGKPIKNLPLEIKLSKEATAAELYQQIAHKSRFPVYQIRVTKGSDGSLLPNDKGIPLAHTGLLEGSKIYVKDLGRQIGWRTCYIIEYLGPILIHPLFYFLRSSIYSKPAQYSTFPAPSTLQTLSVILIVSHFLKREYETIFVHRFSSATMPFTNIFKNCAHYWLLSGAFVSYFVYSPSSLASTTSEKFSLLTWIGIGLFVIGESINLYTHIVLKNLRTPGTTERKIPVGFSFDWVTCPNYMWEIVAWIGIVLVTRSFATAIFAGIGSAQMLAWAKKKERNYRREFGEKYKKKRFVLLAGLL